MRLLTFGEAMIRFAPLDEKLSIDPQSPSMCCPYLRSVGGDELNVAVALSKLGIETIWVSILPKGYFSFFSIYIYFLDH